MLTPVLLKGFESRAGRNLSTRFEIMLIDDFGVTRWYRILSFKCGSPTEKPDVEFEVEPSDGSYYPIKVKIGWDEVVTARFREGSKIPMTSKPEMLGEIQELKLLVEKLSREVDTLNSFIKDIVKSGGKHFEEGGGS